MEDLELSAPARVGPFRVVAVLGQGGMGRVLLGVAPDGRLVAVKEVHAELAEDDGFRARFRREVDASRKVSGAYTAAVIDADPDAVTPWLASQFVPGPSLSQALEAGGALPEASVRVLAAGLARALADVHRAGLIHRDLKPSNVLLAEDGVRVIDFGIVRAVGDQTRITHTGALIGSPAFMSPEQILGRELTPKSDVFALGATLVMACTGSAPFAGDSVPRLLHEVVNAEPDLSAVPPGLRGIIERCLAKDPAARPSPQELPAMVGRVEPSVRPWPEAVHRLIGAQRAEIAGVTGPVGASAERPDGWVARPRRKWSRKVRALVGAGIVAALVACGLTVGRPVVQEVYFMVVPEDVPTPGTVPLSQVQDRYRPQEMTCPELAAGITVPAGFDLPSGYGFTEKDGKWSGPSNLCVWKDKAGDEIYVSWSLFVSRPGGKTGAEQAKESHEEFYGRGRTTRDFGLGYAEEAMWLPPDDKDDESCVLYIRDVNLRAFIAVKGPNYPPGGCKDVTKTAGQGAVAAIPRR
ncbi:serine/threonine-protein kinase [Streptomyces sp. NPDC059874]|uniref:serine/threonine-protein kinase n=1 Tax=Streptomyces sp. NPDC059874 TaxID=3346983 RepID=UPI00364F1F45